MTTRQHDGMVEVEVEGEGVTRPMIKRRGVIAGAAALAAGLLAKQASDPQSVAASAVYQEHVTVDYQAITPWDNSFPACFLGDASLSKADTIGVMGQAGGSQSGVYGLGSDGGGAGVAGRGGATANATGVAGYGTGGGVGVSGNGGPNSATGVLGFGGGTSGQGVAGIGAAPTGPGVVGIGGNFGAGNNADGVQGFANGTGGGVVGHGGGSNGAGLLGIGGAANGQGVAGIGNGTGPGIVGVGGNFVATNNADGVQGFASGTGTGVIGHSPSGLGVYGVGQTYGVRGDAGTAAGAAGLLGVATTANAVAFGSVVVAPATIAGYFNGEVHVEGPFYVDPISNKHGVIAKADGTKHVFYSMESPESWVEDFGTGTLANGKATIALDKDFASVIHADDYLVFLTSHDAANKGLAVTAHKVDGFTVQEQQGGTSSGSFSYRVVARPNVGKKVERMPKYTPPPKVDIAGIGTPIPPLAPPVIEARPVPAVVKRAEPPVLPDARQLNPLKKP